MKMQRWNRIAAMGTALAAVAAPLSLAGAQSLLIGQPRVIAQQGGSELFEWTGQVDREVQIVMRGGNVWTNNIGQTERPRARSRAYSQLPRQDGQVNVQVLNGRGSVDVIQQPSRQNNYTTIVRIVDPRSGSDDYRLAVYWQGYANGDVYGNGNGRNNRDRNGRDRNGRDVYRGRDRDDRDDRDDRGDRDNRDNGGYRNGQYNQEMLHWSGNVDGELELRIQNGRIDYRTISGQQPTNVRANPGYGGGSIAGNLSITQNQGRGSVTVVQQPSQWNAYTTVIRIRDPQGGYGYYDFSVIRM